MSSLWQSYNALSRRNKFGVGIAVLAWGTIGLYISDKAEKKLGFEPTEKDKKALDTLTPKVMLVDRDNTDRD